MNSAGVTPQALVQKWQFAVEVDGFDAAYFTSSDFPGFRFDKVEFNPAGSMFPQKAAGRMEFDDVTMSKGIPTSVDDTALVDWLRLTASVAAGQGGVPSDYMKDIDLVKYDRAGNEHQRFRLYGAWCAEGKFGSGEGGSSDNDMEEITICYQYFEKV